MVRPKACDERGWARNPPLNYGPELRTASSTKPWRTPSLRTSLEYSTQVEGEHGGRGGRWGRKERTNGRSKKLESIAPKTRAQYSWNNKVLHITPFHMILVCIQPKLPSKFRVHQDTACYQCTHTHTHTEQSITQTGEIGGGGGGHTVDSVTVGGRGGGDHTADSVTVN